MCVTGSAHRFQLHPPHPSFLFETHRQAAEKGWPHVVPEGAVHHWETAAQRGCPTPVLQDYNFFNRRQPGRQAIFPLIIFSSCSDLWIDSGQDIRLPAGAGFGKVTLLSPVCERISRCGRFFQSFSDHLQPTAESECRRDLVPGHCNGNTSGR